MLELKLNNETATLLLLTDMQGGNHGAEKKLMHKNLTKHSYNFESTTPDKKYMHALKN